MSLLGSEEGPDVCVWSVCHAITLICLGGLLSCPRLKDGNNCIFEWFFFPPSFRVFIPIQAAADVWANIFTLAHFQAALLA